MQITKMQLGFTFDDLIEDERGYMYFTGTALEEGVWSDMHNNTAFWPRNVIHAGMNGFVGKAITCQHEAAVGKVLDVYATELGFKAKGVITSKSVAALIRTKVLRGLSVTTEAYVDPLRKIVLELINQSDISVVTDPACRVCMLENTWNDTMTTETTETIVEVAASAPEVTLVHTPEDVVDTSEVVTAELGTTETITENISDDSEIEALNMRLSAYEAQVDEYKAKIAEYEAMVADKDIMIAELSAEVSVVRQQNADLAGKQRDELIGAIMSADPNADKAILEKTSTDALGAYLQTVMRLSQKKIVMSAPKGMKINEAPAPAQVKKSETVMDARTTTNAFIEYLKTKQ